jgi:tetrahydromethanopterin S-methyltransferase subunit H
MEYKMIPCNICREDMPELRLTKYNYPFCVKCSESGNKVKAKHGVPVMMGEGDHTWVETLIMDEDQFQNYQNNERALKGLKKLNKSEMQNMDKDDKILYGPIRVIDPK